MSGLSVVFDLDGTLIDTKPDLLNALLFTLDTVDLGHIAPSHFDGLIGSGGRAMISHAFELEGRQLPEAQMTELVNCFLDFYQRHIDEYSRPFPYVSEVLKYLKNNDYLVGICTNKYEYLARQLISSLDMISYFDIICGSDTYAFRKPDGRHIFQTVTDMGGDPGHAVMVGDSVHDFHAARDIQIPCIGVTFGYSAEPISKYEPDEIIETYEEFLPALNRLMKQ